MPSKPVFTQSPPLFLADPAQLEALTAEYHRHFQPTTPLARFLVDSLVDAQWQLRRFRTIEAQLWLHESDAVRKCCNVEEHRTLGLAFIRRVDVFTRLQRRIDAAQRTYARALKQLQGLDGDLDAALLNRKPTRRLSPASPRRSKLASFRHISSQRKNREAKPPGPPGKPA